MVGGSRGTEQEPWLRHRDRPEAVGASMPPSACGFLFCYNEEQILRESLLHYLNQGVDLVVVDNESADGSMQIVADLQCTGSSRPGKIRGVLRVHTEGYEWQTILRQACIYMHRHL